MRAPWILIYYILKYNYTSAIVNRLVKYRIDSFLRRSVCYLYGVKFLLTPHWMRQCVGLIVIIILGLLTGGSKVIQSLSQVVRGGGGAGPSTLSFVAVSGRF